MRVFHIRILLDSSEDIFRDIEIEESANFFELHESLIEAFGFSGLEMASFYKSNEDWEEGEEICLFDLGEEPGEVLIMSETFVEDVVSKEETKLIYIYDFLSMWTFMVELADIVERQSSTDYPNLLFAQGQLDFDMESEALLDDLDEDDPYNLDENEESEDLFDNLDNFGDYEDFDDDWN